MTIKKKKLMELLTTPGVFASTFTYLSTVFNPNKYYTLCPEISFQNSSTRGALIETHKKSKIN